MPARSATRSAPCRKIRTYRGTGSSTPKEKSAGAPNRILNQSNVRFWKKKGFDSTAKSKSRSSATNGNCARKLNPSRYRSPAAGVQINTETNEWRIFMPRGDKSKYTSKQERQAEHIEKGYEQRGVPKKVAEARAWATVNKVHG